MSRLDLDKPKASAKRADRKSARSTVAAKLCASADFRAWLGDILEELCAIEQGFGCYDDFAQGKRAAGSFIISSLRAGGDEFTKAMTTIFADHFGKQVKQDKQEDYE